MTVHRDKFLVNKPTDALNFNFIGITTLHVSGSLSAHHQEFLALISALVNFMQLWWPFATRSRMELPFHPTPGSKRSHLHKMYQSRCTAKNSWWWAERLPETCRVVIPIKLEFDASVGCIHKERRQYLFFMNVAGLKTRYRGKYWDRRGRKLLEVEKSV